MKPSAIANNWAWEETLKAAIGSQVRECVVLDQSSGTTCRTRVQVRPGDGGQRVVFVKTPSRSRIARTVVKLLGLARAEMGFYRDAAPEVPVVVPQSLSVCGERGSFAIVLDDLVTAGAETGELGEELSIEAVEAALVALAEVHGTFWEDRRLASDGWSWCRSFVPAGEATIGWLLAPALSALGRRRAERCLPDDLRSGLTRYAVRRTPMLRGVDCGPRTLLHHDRHPGNLARLPGGRVVLFDWQLARAGPWASDVAYLVATSVATDQRRAHERRLLECYLDALQAAGGRPPALAEAWHAYVANLVYPLEAMVMTLALSAMQPAGAVASAVRRTSAAVADHDAFAALAAYPGSRP